MNITGLQALLKSLADGLVLISDVSKGFSLTEIGELIQVGQDVQAFTATAGSVIPQWESLSATDQATLLAYVQANIKFPSNTDVQVYTQKVLAVAIALSQVFQAWNTP